MPVHFWGGVVPTTLCGLPPERGGITTLPAWEGSFMRVTCRKCLRQMRRCESTIPGPQAGDTIYCERPDGHPGRHAAYSATGAHDLWWAASRKKKGTRS